MPTRTSAASGNWRADDADTWGLGADTYPAAGDTMFTNSAGTAVADPKHYHYEDGGTDKKIHITGTDGYVAGISNCAP